MREPGPTPLPPAVDSRAVSVDATSGSQGGVGRREIETAARRRSGTGAERLRRIGLGILGGLIATVAMTVFRMPISDSLPPTANFWAKYVGGGEPEDHPVAGLILHLVYGAGGGALFGLLAPIPSIGAEHSQEVRGVVAGLVYGGVLSVFGERAILVGLLGMDPQPDERLIFHLGHVIYGLTLGAWVGSKVD